MNANFMIMLSFLLLTSCGNYEVATNNKGSSALEASVSNEADWELYDAQLKISKELAQKGDAKEAIKLALHYDQKKDEKLYHYWLNIAAEIGDCNAIMWSLPASYEETEPNQHSKYVILDAKYKCNLPNINNVKKWINKKGVNK